MSRFKILSCLLCTVFLCACGELPPQLKDYTLGPVPANQQICSNTCLSNNTTCVERCQSKETMCENNAKAAEESQTPAGQQFERYVKQQNKKGLPVEKKLRDFKSIDETTNIADDMFSDIVTGVYCSELSCMNECYKTLHACHIACGGTVTPPATKK